jgi:hypothetical protein
MLRETTFWIGGVLTIGLGIALGAGLFWAGAGFEFFDAWLASGIAVGFGAFFVYVGRGEHRERLAFLARTEEELAPPPRSGSP